MKIKMCCLLEHLWLTLAAIFHQKPEPILPIIFCIDQVVAILVVYEFSGGHTASAL